MSTSALNVDNAIAHQMPPRPTLDEIDALADRLHAAKNAKILAANAFESLEDEAVRMVTTFGIVPPNAEKSRRLAGRLAELTVTKSDTITIDDARVIDLRDALATVGRNDFFKRLFTIHSKFEIVEGAESGHSSPSCCRSAWPRRSSTCSAAASRSSSKKPSLKVVIADPAKPKKSRAKKGQAN